MNSKTAPRADALVGNRWRFTNSRLIVANRLSAAALSNADPTPPMDPAIPASWRRRVNASEMYREPWSEWRTSPAPGRRRDVAISRASTTSSKRRCSANDHPTIRREQQSRIVDVGLVDPPAQRLGGDAEVLGDLPHGPSRGPVQRYRLSPELGHVPVLPMWTPFRGRAPHLSGVHWDGSRPKDHVPRIGPAMDCETMRNAGRSWGEKTPGRRPYRLRSGRPQAWRDQTHDPRVGGSSPPAPHPKSQVIQSVRVSLPAEGAGEFPPRPFLLEGATPRKD